MLEARSVKLKALPTLPTLTNYIKQNWKCNSDLFTPGTLDRNQHYGNPRSPCKKAMFYEPSTQQILHQINLFVYGQTEE